jgi:hypothetical protein
MNEGQRIASIAKGYIGQQEVRGNKGFKDAFFEEKMKAVGWNVGEAWCATFAELVWREAYAQMNSEVEHELRSLFSSSATKTFSNFKFSKYGVSKKPEVGSLVCFKYGKGWQGHIGIVVAINGKEMVCVEGNTNTQGGREGIEVGEVRRILDFTSSDDKLNLLGFVNPIKA